MQGKLERLLTASQKANSILTLILDDVDWLHSDSGLHALAIVKREVAELENIAEAMMWAQSDAACAEEGD